jgi:predicted Ser/Thr protein kinase
MVSDVNGYKTKEEWFLGKGTFGSVYKAEKDGKFFAVKIFQTEFLKDEYKKFLDREIQALQKIATKCGDLNSGTEGYLINKNMFRDKFIVRDSIRHKEIIPKWQKKRKSN